MCRPKDLVFGSGYAALEGLLQGNQMVPGAGLEPAHAFAHRLLRTACLPIPPPRHCSQTKRKARVPTQARAQIKSLEVRLYLILKQRGARPVKVRLCAPPGGGGTFRRDSVAIQVGGGPGSDLWHPKGGRQTPRSNCNSMLPRFSVVLTCETENQVRRFHFSRTSLTARFCGRSKGPPRIHSRTLKGATTAATRFAEAQCSGD